MQDEDDYVHDQEGFDTSQLSEDENVNVNAVSSEERENSGASSSSLLSSADFTVGLLVKGKLFTLQDSTAVNNHESFQPDFIELRTTSMPPPASEQQSHRLENVGRIPNSARNVFQI